MRLVVTICERSTNLYQDKIYILHYNKVFNYLGIEKEVEYKDIFDVHYLDNLKLKDCDILYKRLNVNEELQYIKDNIKQV